MNPATNFLVTIVWLGRLSEHVPGALDKGLGNVRKPDSLPALEPASWDDRPLRVYDCCITN